MSKLVDRATVSMEQPNDNEPSSHGDQPIGHRPTRYKSGATRCGTIGSDSDVRLATIAKIANDGIITTDERGLVDTFNAGAERLFGYHAHDVIGKNVSLLMPSLEDGWHEECHAGNLSGEDRSFDGGGREVMGRRRDGSTFPVRLLVGEMRLGGTRCFTGIVHDISAQQQAEERALRAERLAAIGQMISAVTHESRNVLQRMSTNLEMAAMESAGRPEVLEYISRVRSAQNDLARLFEELRDFAAPIKLDLEPCSLDELIKEVLDEFSGQSNERRIECRSIFKGSDSRCEVDVFRIAQVFRNMIENSLAACDDPIFIELRAVNAELNGQAAIKLSYRDNGPGLNEEQRRRVFEPFFTTKPKGSGLGMPISKRIVEAHGGRMALGATRDSGAEFLITLPRRTLARN
ncbi:PAS domain S-box protein [Roseiconus nitratireducens]|uniref:histidine kinase n=1 Tax=Roseiconus nitratireducens TaxID=2605748 RepID=A0A5M6D5A6_9BACT|nr:PAS domain S-box protein [Roseiconus nitratireducens]KAA5542671.1 PAS domain S-box protein [Roseiconus nitratireducens]